MAEPLAAAVHAVDRGSDAADVGILGGGPMGLMIAAMLVAQGRSVSVADHHASRRAQAEQLGARAVERLDRHDLVFEVVGRRQAWESAVLAAAPGGAVVLVGGCPGGTEVTFPATPIHYDELELRGAFHHSRAEVDRAILLLAAGAVNWRELLGETIALEDLPAALATPSGGPAKKWVIDPAARRA
jgi:L-iditol 2-dehydrogenase